ncbi:START domain-containing protein [bacterium A37T11]|nr:START domain-containing protein [bacterium A37T11]
MLSSCLTNAFTQENWKFVTNKQGINVYSKAVADSKVKAIKATCELDASASQLVKLLLDVKAGEEWVYHTKSCKLLKQVSPAELYYYSEINIPWPLENRDFVAHMRASQDKETKVVTIDGPAVSGWVDPREGIVRISQSKGRWVIKPISKQKIQVEYTLQVDPGGVIPAWMVNMFAAQGPIESFKKMKEQLKLPKYQNAQLPFIAD